MDDYLQSVPITTPTKDLNAATEAWDYFRDTYHDTLPNLSSLAERIGMSPLTEEAVVTTTEVGLDVGVDAVGMPEIMGALAFFLGMYVFGWIVTWVGNVFPNPSVFGWHPLDFIKTGIQDLGKQEERFGLDAAQFIATPIIQPIRQIVALFQRLMNGTAAAHRKVAHVVNTAIPAAVAGAIAASEQYSRDQVALVDQAAQQATVNITENMTLAQAKVLVSDAARFGGLKWDLTGMMAAAVVATDEYAQSLHTLSSAEIQTAATKTAADAADALKTVQTSLLSQLSGDSAAIASLTNVVGTQVPTEIAQAVQAAAATQDANLARATIAIGQQITALQGEITTLADRVATDEQIIAASTAEISKLQSAETIDAAAITAQSKLITTAQSDILSNITTINDLQTKITGISSTLAPIQAAQQLNTAQLSPFEIVGAVALPTLLATLSNTLSQVKTKVDTCSVETCDPTSPLNIKNQLMNLLEMLTAAGEIGFIAEAINDPQGTANALAPLLDSIDNSAVSALDTLLAIL
jgi:predicted  nucleic acid-binding Zn-ribbon protein